jgi:hypothetical protein
MEEHRKIMLRTSETEKVSDEKFRQIMQIDSDTTFRVSDLDSLSYFEENFSSIRRPIIVYFFETDEVGNFINSKNEDDFQWEGPNGEEYEGGDYIVWWESKCEERIQMATEWMLSRQDSFLELQNLGMKMDIYFLFKTSEAKIELPSSFVSVCGKLNLPIILDYNVS